MTSVTPQRILITRLSAVGDCVQTMPLACAFRDLFPQAHIAWVVERAAAPAGGDTGGNQSRDHRAQERAAFAARDLAHSPRAVGRAVRPGPRSAVAAEKRGAGLALGRRRQDRVCSARGPRNRALAELPARQKPGRAPDRSLSGAARAAGRQSAAATVRAADSDQAEAFAAEATADRRLAMRICRAQSRRGLGLAAVADRSALRKSPGNWPAWGIGSLVTWGGNRERGWAEEVVAAAAGSAVLAPPTSLVELTAIIRRRTAVLGADTGPLHLAAAIGTPCIGLFGTTAPRRDRPARPAAHPAASRL